MRSIAFAIFTPFYFIKAGFMFHCQCSGQASE